MLCIGRYGPVNGSSVNVHRRKRNDRFVEVFLQICRGVLYAW